MLGNAIGQVFDFATKCDALFTEDKLMEVLPMLGFYFKARANIIVHKGIVKYLQFRQSLVPDAILVLQARRLVMAF